MSGNSSASSDPPDDENKPLKTDEELIEMLKNARAAERLPTETQLRFNHMLEAASDPFGRTNVQRRDWERRNGVVTGSYKPVVFIPNRPEAEIALLNNRPTIPYPPTPQPAPVTVTVDGTGTTTGSPTLPTEVSILRRRKRETSEDRKANGESVPNLDMRTRKSLCEELGNCSIQGGSRKRSKKSKASKKSKKSRGASRRSKKSNRTTRKH
jgi:hypothetical protein